MNNKMTGKFDMLEQVLTAVHILNEPKGVSSKHVVNFVMDRMDGLLSKRRNEIRKVSVSVRSFLEREQTPRLSNATLCNHLFYTQDITSSALKHDDNILGISNGSLRRRSLPNRRIRKKSYSKKSKQMYLRKFTNHKKFDKHTNHEQSAYDTESEETR